MCMHGWMGGNEGTAQRTAVCMATHVGGGMQLAGAWQQRDAAHHSRVSALTHAYISLSVVYLVYVSILYVFDAMIPFKAAEVSAWDVHVYVICACAHMTT